MSHICRSVCNTNVSAIFSEHSRSDDDSAETPSSHLPPETNRHQTQIVVTAQIPLPRLALIHTQKKLHQQQNMTSDSSSRSVRVSARCYQTHHTISLSSFCLRPLPGSGTCDFWTAFSSRTDPTGGKQRHCHCVRMSTDCQAHRTNGAPKQSICH